MNEKYHSKNLGGIFIVRNAAHTLKVFARQFLDNRLFDKGSKELDHLTSNFPSVLEDFYQPIFINAPQIWLMPFKLLFYNTLRFFTK